jgi:hypothetical protein
VTVCLSSPPSVHHHHAIAPPPLLSHTFSKIDAPQVADIRCSLDDKFNSWLDAHKSTTAKADTLERDQMLPISLTKSSSSFLVSAYFLAISSYLVSHWSRDCSRAWTLRS